MSNPILSLEHMSDVYKIEPDRLFERLLWKLNSCRHVFLLADPGWGIREYVDELGLQLTEKNPEMLSIYLDMRSAHSPGDFLELFASAFLQRFPEENSTLEMGRGHAEVLRLPELIARRKKNRLVIFLGNAHLFFRFKYPNPFLRTLKLYLRVQKNCTYCFYGNKSPGFRELLAFSGPLHGFGQLHELNHNPAEHRSAFIRKLFHDHKKRIAYLTSVNMSFAMDNHPFYLKLLAWHSLVMTRDICTQSIVDKSLHNLILHFEYAYYRTTESLTQKQLYFLRALLDGNQKLYSGSTREAYLLGSSSNVAKITACLEKREIIRTGRHETGFTDPLFREWLRRRYFADDR